MPLNKESQPEVCAPRALVKLTGSDKTNSLALGWSDIEVVNNNATSADTFHVTINLDLQEIAYQEKWFTGLTDLYVEVFFGFPDVTKPFGENDLRSFIYGQVDDIAYDIALGEIYLTGRDLTRVFIDTKSTEKYQNQTASQIATLLANKHNLTPVVTPTSTIVGKYYEIDHVHMTDERTEWELLIYLANQENFQVYVRGQSLYFCPKLDADTAPDAYYLVVNKPKAPGEVLSGNFIDLQLKRALTVSRGITVTGRSWNSKLGKLFTSFYPSKGKGTRIGKSTPFGDGQNYARNWPGLDQVGLDKKTQAYYEQIIANEMVVQAELPGDVYLDTQTIVRVFGTETSFDQDYYPNSIARTFNINSGFSMRVVAKNHATETQATL